MKHPDCPRLSRSPLLNERGFMAVEGVIGLVLVGIIGLVGYLALQNHKLANTPAKVVVAASPSPKTTPVLKVSFAVLQAAASKYCKQQNSNDTYQKGQLGDDGKLVASSMDEKFAYINGICKATSDRDGTGELFLLTQQSGEWTVIGTLSNFEPIDYDFPADLKQKYGVPAYRTFK